MSEVGLPSVGAILCFCGFVIPSKFGFGGGGVPTTSSADGDFLFPLRARTLVSLPPWAWRAAASVPVVIAGPTCSPTGIPTCRPRAAVRVLAVVEAAPPRFPTGTPSGKPSVLPRVLVPVVPSPVGPPENTWGLAHVGSGRSLASGGRSKLTTGPRPAVRAIAGDWDCFRHRNAHPSGSATHLSHASAHINPPRFSRRTSAGMDEMPNLAINDAVCAFIPASSSTSCHIDNHGIFSR